MITLTNVGSTYDFVPAARGLGIGLFDFRGVAAIRFVVYVQRLGTGIQSWQLWNETNQIEICRIDDNDIVSPAVRYLDQTFPVNIDGIKLVRVRAKSSISGDDPIFFGSTIFPNP